MNVRDCSDLSVGEGRRVTSRSETRSFAGVPLGGAVIIRKDGYGGQDDLLEVLFDDLASSRRW